MKTAEMNTLNADLANLRLDDVNILFERVGQGMPNFAASSGTYCSSPDASSSSADIE
jgi:hypothetical protein